MYVLGLNTFILLSISTKLFEFDLFRRIDITLWILIIFLAKKATTNHATALLYTHSLQTPNESFLPNILNILAN